MSDPTLKATVCPQCGAPAVWQVAAIAAAIIAHDDGAAAGRAQAGKWRPCRPPCVAREHTATYKKGCSKLMMAA
jgi:hypothetical protein